MNLLNTLPIYPGVRDHGGLTRPPEAPLDGVLYYNESNYQIRIGSATDQKIFSLIMKANNSLISQYNVKGETIIMPRDLYYKAISSLEFLRYGTIKDITTSKDTWGGMVLPQILGMEIKIGNKFEVKTSPLYNKTVDLTYYLQKMWFCLHKLVILVKSRVRDEYRDFNNMSPEESKALDTLREMISEADFRRYLIYGFILVKGLSGKIYQISRFQRHTKVWEKGKKVEEVCAYIKDPKIPSTDKLIAFKTMIETDEELFRKAGNVYKFQGA